MNHEEPSNHEALPPEHQPQDVDPDGMDEQHEGAPSTPPRIWVASLSDYNNGIQHGAWIAAAQDEEALQTDIDAVLTASPWTARSGEPAEEWAIHDYDGFGRLRIDEHESLHWISLVGKGIAEHGLAFAAWADVVEEEERLADFGRAYLGHYNSLHAYVEQRINDLGYDRILDEVVPSTIRPYVKIDITRTANDLLEGSDLHALPAPDGGVWIFNG